MSEPAAAPARGQPAPRIPHSRPALGERERDAAAAAIASGQIGPGREVEAYEQALARICGRRFGIAVHSGTAALHLALLGLEIGPGDEVILPSYACTALLNAVRYVRAQPVLVDVEDRTGNIDPAWLVTARSDRTRAVIVPHLFGLPARIEAILPLGVPVIEDCAMCLGTTRLSRPVGSWGTVAIVSTYATKMIATGQGGAILSDEANLHERMKDLVLYDNREDDRMRYNLRLSDLAAAVGRVQASRLDEFVRERRAVAGRYREGLAGTDLRLPPNDAEHAYHRFIVQIVSEDPAEVIRRGKAAGVEIKRPVFRPLHRHLRLDPTGFRWTESMYETTLSLPCYPGLNKDDQDRVIRAVVG